MGAYSSLYAHLLDYLACDPSVLPDRGFKSPSGWPGITVREFAAQRLLESFLKKNQDRESENAEAVAVATWRSCNDHCKGWQPQSNTSADDLLLGEFRRFCWDIFGSGNLIKSWTQVHDLGRVGPGSSLGARGTDMYSKLFSSGLASTNDVLHTLWNHNVREHNLWFQADICRSEVHSPLLVEARPELKSLLYMSVPRAPKLEPGPTLPRSWTCVHDLIRLPLPKISQQNRRNSPRSRSSAEVFDCGCQPLQWSLQERQVATATASAFSDSRS